MPARNTAPLVAHVVHSLRVGGLENGLINLINGMPQERYRHAVICLSDYDRFADRIARDDVRLFALERRAGKDPRMYLRLWRVFRELRPDIVHTRNLGTVDAHLPALLAGVRARIHGEHGRDMGDLRGDNRRHRRIRRLCRPLIHRFVPLSRDLEAYLRDAIGVAPARTRRIVNGVDVERFRPDRDGRERTRLLAERDWPAGCTLIGWVGRMEAVKNPLGLVEAFAAMRAQASVAAAQPRLVLIGAGSQQERVRRAVSDRGLGEVTWLPGGRDDIPRILRALDLFVLPSLAEGISNTLLEAMASGLPVVATRVGGNPELVVDACGELVAPGDETALARTLAGYVVEPARRAAAGTAARQRALEHFSIDTMVDAYLEVYDTLLAERATRRAAPRRTPTEPA